MEGNKSFKSKIPTLLSLKKSTASPQSTSPEAQSSSAPDVNKKKDTPALCRLPGTSSPNLREVSASFSVPKFKATGKRQNAVGKLLKKGVMSLSPKSSPKLGSGVWYSAAHKFIRKRLLRSRGRKHMVLETASVAESQELRQQQDRSMTLNETRSTFVDAVSQSSVLMEVETPGTLLDPVTIPRREARRSLLANPPLASTAAGAGPPTDTTAQASTTAPAPNWPAASPPFLELVSGLCHCLYTRVCSICLHLKTVQSLLWVLLSWRHGASWVFGLDLVSG
ncbi:hypothetical protein CPC08DRAFT_761667 [Agrocybe pediades]|nr:hypothetical protein CPC08DRAFT_761667 [Agrocybe pediades]